MVKYKMSKSHKRKAKANLGGRCLMWKDGMCNSMYNRGLRCIMKDGKDIPKECPYNGNFPKYDTHKHDAEMLSRPAKIMRKLGIKENEA